MKNLVKEAQVLYDVKGKKTHVVLPIKTYEKLLEYLEEFDDLRAIREVAHEKPIPWEEAKKILAKKRNR